MILETTDKGKTTSITSGVGIECIDASGEFLWNTYRDRKELFEALEVYRLNVSDLNSLRVETRWKEAREASKLYLESACIYPKDVLVVRKEDMICSCCGRELTVGEIAVKAKPFRIRKIEGDKKNISLVVCSKCMKSKSTSLIEAYDSINKLHEKYEVAWKEKLANT